MARITSKITSIDEQILPSIQPTTNASSHAGNAAIHTNEAPLELDVQTDPPIEQAIRNQTPTASPQTPETKTQQAATKTTQQTPPERSLQTLSDEQPSGRFGWIWFFIITLSLIWIAALVYFGWFVFGLDKKIAQFSLQQWAGLSVLALGPLLLLWITGACLKQIKGLSTQANALQHAANVLITPHQAVTGQAQNLAYAIAQQIDLVDDRMNAALGRLATLEDVISVQTKSLVDVNQDTRVTADHITSVIQNQTEALDGISNTFDDRMQALSTALSGHTDKLAHATQIAEQKIKEARISVEGATAKINSASDIVRSNTVQAASTLSASHADISSLGQIIRERSNELDNVYKKHANDLTAMIEQLRDEQQNLGAILEERLTKMRDLSLSAQASAESLTTASAAGKDTIEALAKSATLADTAVKNRFVEMQDMVRYSNEHATSLSDKAAQRVKDSLEITRKEIRRIEMDMSDLQGRIGETRERAERQNQIKDEPIDDEPDYVLSQSKAKESAPKSPLKLQPILDDNSDNSNDEATSSDNTPTHSESIASSIGLRPLAPKPDQAIEDTPAITTSTQDENDDILDLYYEAEPEPKAEQEAPSLIVETPPENLTAPAPAQPSLFSPAATPSISDKYDDKSASISVLPDYTGTTSDLRPPLSIAPFDDKADISSKPLLANKSEAVRRTSINSETDKPKSGFIRSLFGSRPAASDASLSIAASTPKTVKQTSSPYSYEAPNQGNDIVDMLGKLGLDPNNIVDDGCVIEAANTRSTQGHEPMSRITAQRLSNPVAHLANAFSLDQLLCDAAIGFASQYDQTIQALNSDRESIRLHLESEDGRTYLLCDAALNFGRV